MNAWRSGRGLGGVIVISSVVLGVGVPSCGDSGDARTGATTQDAAADRAEATADGIDCSTVGCSPAPRCSDGCTAICGCCPCSEASRMGTLVCHGGCYEHAADATPDVQDAVAQDSEPETGTEDGADGEVPDVGVEAASDASDALTMMEAMLDAAAEADGVADADEPDATADIDCSVIGCSLPPLCSEACTAPCGCCSCSGGGGELELDGGFFQCSADGSCLVPVVDCRTQGCGTGYWCQECLTGPTASSWICLPTGSVC